MSINHYVCTLCDEYWNDKEWNKTECKECKKIDYSICSTCKLCNYNCASKKHEGRILLIKVIKSLQHELDIINKLLDE